MSPDHIPLRLERAVELAFPEGGMTVSGLRKEIGRGNLAASRIAGKHFVTLAAIKEMIPRASLRPSSGWRYRRSSRPACAG